MDQPKYEQIADDLRMKIDSGEYGPGSRLPTELDLGHQYEASRNTVRNAVNRLTRLGLVQTRPGQGTFVTPRPEPLVVLPHPARRHRVRDLPHGLRPASTADAGNGDGLPSRP